MYLFLSKYLKSEIIPVTTQGLVNSEKLVENWLIKYIHMCKSSS